MSKNHENFEFFINFFKTVSGAILPAELDKITQKMSFGTTFGHGSVSYTHLTLPTIYSV